MAGETRGLTEHSDLSFLSFLSASCAFQGAILTTMLATRNFSGRCCPGGLSLCMSHALGFRWQVKTDMGAEKLPVWTAKDWLGLSFLPVLLFLPPGTCLR